VTDVLGLIALAVFILAVIGLAAGVTALVVKLSPTKEAKAMATDIDSES
jgi:hypothetical protein